MKLVCTIGTQGFADGSRYYRGDVYEVDDETASTLIAHRYATVYVEPEEEPAIPTEPEAPADTDVAVTDDEVVKLAEAEGTDVQPPMEEKTTKRRKGNKR